jgi:hypothetical protein
MKEYKLGSIVTMKKGHPCGTNEWEIIRMGADIKLKCLGCNRVVMLSRIDFNKRLKKVLINKEQL